MSELDIRDWPSTDIPDELEKAIQNALLEFASVENRVFIRGLIVKAYTYGWFSHKDMTEGYFHPSVVKAVEKEYQRQLSTLQSENERLGGLAEEWAGTCRALEVRAEKAEAQNAALRGAVGFYAPDPELLDENGCFIHEAEFQRWKERVVDNLGEVALKALSQAAPAPRDSQGGEG